MVLGGWFAILPPRFFFDSYDQNMAIWLLFKQVGFPGETCSGIIDQARPPEGFPATHPKCIPTKEPKEPGPPGFYMFLCSRHRWIYTSFPSSSSDVFVNLAM